MSNRSKINFKIPLLFLTLLTVYFISMVSRPASIVPLSLLMLGSIVYQFFFIKSKLLRFVVFFLSVVAAFVGSLLGFILIDNYRFSISRFVRFISGFFSIHDSGVDATLSYGFSLENMSSFLRIFLALPENFRVITLTSTCLTLVFASSLRTNEFRCPKLPIILLVFPVVLSIITCAITKVTSPERIFFYAFGPILILSGLSLVFIFRLLISKLRIQFWQRFLVIMFSLITCLLSTVGTLNPINDKHYYSSIVNAQNLNIQSVYVKSILNVNADILWGQKFVQDNCAYSEYSFCLKLHGYQFHLGNFLRQILVFDLPGGKVLENIVAQKDFTCDILERSDNLSSFYGTTKEKRGDFYLCDINIRGTA